MGEPVPKGIFHSLSLGRARPTPSKGPSETLAHPLLAASSSTSSVHESTAAPSQPEAGPSRNVSGSGDILNVPYKPRQRGMHGSINSVSSITSVTATTSTSPNLPPSGPTTSPVTPAGMPAPPTTSTSTSTTFALPQSAETISDVSNSSSATGTATGRLQLQSLKAAAQKIGLGNGSMGMALLDAIFEKSQMGKIKGDSAEWAEVLKLLSSGKAVLLLPSAPASSLSVNPQSLRDHVAFLSPSIPLSLTGSGTPGGNGDSANILVTLSGLVGAIQHNAVTFESTLPAESSISLSLKDPAARSATLSALRPSSIVTPASSHYPSFELSPETTCLSFPPLNQGTSNGDGKDASKTAATGKLGRINPFASFFNPNSGSTPAMGSSPGSQSITSPASPSKKSVSISTPDRPISPSPSTLSPKPSVSNLDPEVSSIRSEGTARDPEGYQVMAYTISKPIRFADVNKALPKAIKAAIKDDLNRLPEKVLDRVYKIVVAGACPTYSSSSDSKSDAQVIPQLDFADPSTTGEKLQEFVESVYDDLLIHYQADSSHIFAENSDFASMRRKTSWTRRNHSGENVEVDSEEAKRERKEKQRRERDAKAEKNATQATDRVEAVICRMLYNRLFSPLESDDSRHDEALASRIAALNILDLSLDHLGLITRPTDVPPEEEGVIAKGLADIVDNVGGELQKLSLPTYLTPKDKADALIKAHKIVVDGLMKLPPIDLRPEDEPYKPDAPVSSRPTSPLDEGAADAVRTVTSSTSIPDIIIEDKDSSGSPIPSSKPKRSSSSDSTPLSGSPPSADPLSSIAEVSETTPNALQSTIPTAVPELTLPEAKEESEASQIEQAMSDSMIDALEPEKETSPPASVDEEKKPGRSGTSGADLILPIIIYAVVKSNPPQLASQLMYLRRYRSAICLTGEASYAIVNLTAVVEFLEHVELSQLGLGDSSGKVMSVEDLSPIGLNYLDETNADAASIASASSRLRGRVFQVGELAGSAADSANKVITGVVDSSWTALRGLISAPSSASATGEEDDAGSIMSSSVGSRPAMRPRQASTFSLASVTASVATIAAAAANRSRSRANSRASAVMNAQKEEVHTWKGNEEMVEVTSRPESVRDRGVSDYPSSDEEDVDHNFDRRESLQREDQQMRRGSGDRELAEIRSNKSSTSLASPGEGQEKEKDKDRSSLSNRLASIGVLRSSTPSSSGEGAPSTGLFSGITSARHGTGTGSGGHSRRVSLLGGVAGERAGSIRADSSPVPSLSSLPPIQDHGIIEPPNEHFMTCDAGDIRLSEVGELLRDYRRLGLIVQALGNRQA